MMTTEVYTNASQVNLGAVLVQGNSDGFKHNLASKLSESEHHFHSNKLECTEVVWSVDGTIWGQIRYGIS